MTGAAVQTAKTKLTSTLQKGAQPIGAEFLNDPVLRDSNMDLLKAVIRSITQEKDRIDSYVIKNDQEQLNCLRHILEDFPDTELIDYAIEQMDATGGNVMWQGKLAEMGCSIACATALIPKAADIHFVHMYETMLAMVPGRAATAEEMETMVTAYVTGNSYEDSGEKKLLKLAKTYLSNAMYRDILGRINKRRTEYNNRVKPWVYVNGDFHRK